MTSAHRDEPRAGAAVEMASELTSSGRRANGAHSRTALRFVEVGTQRFAAYRSSAHGDQLDAVYAAAASLKGARVLHVNATPYGGGVAELLRSEVPLLRDLGLRADWALITGDDEFFHVTKAIHDGLQGKPGDLHRDAWNAYERNTRHTAASFTGGYDLVVVHDPQPLALPHFHGRGDSKWVWRCHIDTSEPDAEVWGHLDRYFDDFDAAVFTAPAFVPKIFPISRVSIIAPAIDPESPKNVEIDDGLARRLLQWLGVDLERPLVVQVSRFDRWKDPLGVIEAFRLAQRQVGNLQLALVGSMALDDPDAWAIYDDVLEATRGSDDIYVFTNLHGVSNVEVNAFQRLARVVIQKSLREGFGLVVSESLWKATPVVAGCTGGIPLQLSDGVGGYLVTSVEECAERIVQLIDDPELSMVLGARGREHVRQHYLLPRLLGDELELYRALLG